MSESQIVEFLYTNYRGETSVRKVLPIKIWFGKTDWHPEPQWLMDATDIEKNELRNFAIKDIKEWRSLNGADK